jgi:hypothetical protein
MEERDEYPVPKSSMATETPRSLRPRMSPVTPSTPKAETDSVISTSNADPSVPVSRKASSSEGREGRVPELHGGYVHGDAEFRIAAAARRFRALRAARIIHSPRGTMSPEYSARGMKRTAERRSRLPVATGAAIRSRWDCCRTG